MKSPKPIRTPEDYALWAALPMAQTSQVESRLKMILDKSRCRRRLTRRVLSITLGFSIVSLMALAVMRPAARAQVASNPVSVQSHISVPVEIVGITDATVRDGVSWNSEGTRLANHPFDTMNWAASKKTTVQPGEIGRYIAFQRSPALRSIILLFDFPDYSLGGLTVRSPGRGAAKGKILVDTMRSVQIESSNNLIIYGAAFPASLTHTKIRVGADIGPWLPIYTAVNLSGRHPITTGKASSKYLAKDITISRDKITVKFITPAESDFLMTAVYRDGHKVISPMYGSFTKNEAQISASLPRSPSPIQELRIEARPLVWKEFKNVALQPVK